MMPTAPTPGGLSESELPRWEIDASEFCSRIERNRAPLKIVLKTKNERFFIKRWIDHHMRIVGLENLIVFDHMSDDPEVLSVYRGYRDWLKIIRFADLRNNLHHSGLYPDLYRSLAKTAEYFLFLDTDEYLVLIENDRYYDNEQIVAFITESSDFDLFPGTWLWNANWNARQFKCGDLAGDMAAGKPLIRSCKMPLGYVNHTFQLSTRLFAPPFKTNIFLLHLRQLVPDQRIETNLNKVIESGVAQIGESPESVAALSDITDEAISGYIKEIRDCLALRTRSDLGLAALGAGCMELLPGGTISYYSQAERKAINDFIADPKSAYESLPRQLLLNEVGGAGIDTAAYSLGRLYI